MYYIYMEALTIKCVIIINTFEDQEVKIINAFASKM